MHLSKQTISSIKAAKGLALPRADSFSLPEKVLQFGTGVLLRGLPDYFIDKANRAGIFNGRIVMVKSTNSGDSTAFSTQDQLYSLCIRGIENGKSIEETIIVSAVSRVLHASTEWATVLQCAHDPAIRIIISNTTEVGIIDSTDDISSGVPLSYPGKLLAFLYERFKSVGENDDSGFVIIPTELIADNAGKLKSILVKLAKHNRLPTAFTDWLLTKNHFCNSLVDRIVPGKLSVTDQAEITQRYGYADELMIMAESFRLWAIESSSEEVSSILSFSQADQGVIIAPDIEKFRELKLRLLNGTHTFTCALAYLSGFDTVKDAMVSPRLSAFVQALMLKEIAPLLVSHDISQAEANHFAKTVIDRFGNPFLEHQWLSISLNFTAKMRLRNIPLLLKYANDRQASPQLMCLGFAAYLLFMKCSLDDDGSYYGERSGKRYKIQDPEAAFFAASWKELTGNELVKTILENKQLWGQDLSMVGSLVADITVLLNSLETNDPLILIQASTQTII